MRGENLARLYERTLRRADPERPEARVFAGHRGVGKTSELRRLKGFLEDPEHGGDKPFLVLYSDVSRSLDLNDLDFPDLLVFLAAELQQQLQNAKIPGNSGPSQYLKRLWDEFKGLLGSEVSLGGAEVEVPYGKLALELKNRPSARSELRQAIERQSTNLLFGLNDLLREATVRTSGWSPTKRKGAP